MSGTSDTGDNSDRAEKMAAGPPAVPGTVPLESAPQEMRAMSGTAKNLIIAALVLLLLYIIWAEYNVGYRLFNSDYSEAREYGTPLMRSELTLPEYLYPPGSVDPKGSRVGMDDELSPEFIDYVIERHQPLIGLDFGITTGDINILKDKQIENNKRLTKGPIDLKLSDINTVEYVGLGLAAASSVAGAIGIYHYKNTLVDEAEHTPQSEKDAVRTEVNGYAKTLLWGALIVLVIFLVLYLIVYPDGSIYEDLYSYEKQVPHVCTDTKKDTNGNNIVDVDGNDVCVLDEFGEPSFINTNMTTVELREVTLKGGERALARLSELDSPELIGGTLNKVQRTEPMAKSGIYWTGIMSGIMAAVGGALFMASKPQ